jgi:hypothetical protein
VPAYALRRELDVGEKSSKASQQTEQGVKPCSRQKKSRAASPALKIVSTLFSRKF